MKNNYLLSFYNAAFLQYCAILENDEIREKVANFLLKYVSIEAMYKKMLITSKEADGVKLSKKEKHKLGVQAKEVISTLKVFGIEPDVALIERLFGSNDKNYMECSIKKLRDRFVHSVNDKVLMVILERYENMDNDMDAFVQLLKQK